MSFSLGEGSSPLARYEWDAAAKDAGVSPEGSGFRGVSFHFITESRETVDETISQAVAAGGSVVREAAAAQWGGYYGYFSDLTATSGRSRPRRSERRPSWPPQLGRAAAVA